MKLQEYNFDVEYIKGEENAADELSRLYSCGNIELREPKEIQNQEEIKKIILDYHYASGHGSAKNMKFLIKEKYKWTKMFQDIDEYVEKCPTCAKSGNPRINTKNKIITSQYPNELWVCDLVGRLPLTSRGNKYIIIMIDNYTKWVESKAIPDKSAATIIKAINEHIIRKHGLPKKIISDSGLEFKNRGVDEEFVSTLGIDWKFSSPEHHKTTGAAERVIQTLFGKLRKLCNFTHTNWDLKLSSATNGTNISFNRSIGTSPYILTKSLSPNLNIDLELNNLSIPYNKQQLLKTRDSNFKKYAEKNIVKGEKEITEKLEIGQKALLYRNVLGDEFKARWKPDYYIKEIVLPDAYILEKDGKTIRANKTHVKSQSF